MPVPLERVVVLHGPGVPVHEASLHAWCAAAGARPGAAVVSLEVFPSGETLAAGLRTALNAPATAILLVPGAATEAAIQLACTATRGQLIWLETAYDHGAPDARLGAAQVQTVRGRGVSGYTWALRSLLEQAAWPGEVVAYGDGRDQQCDLRVPAGEGPWPVLALIHGGAWRSAWERDLMDAMAVDLAARGYATWNVEYRRVGEGGGWPQTFDDVAAAIDRLATVDAPLELDRVGIIGHSAGGHLGLWAAGRHRLPAGAPGADPVVRPSFVLSLAGLSDLEDSARRGVYDRGAELLLGGLPDSPEAQARYALASPHRLLPLGARQLLVHGTADLPDNVDMNRVYAETATAAGDDVTLVELVGEDHFSIIEPRSVAWRAIIGDLAAAFPAGSTA